MAVEPLTSPKAIDMKSFDKFYNLQYRLKSYDIVFFGNLLSLVGAKKDLDYEEIKKYVTKQIENMSNIYYELICETQLLYHECDLVYDAVENPFFE